MRVKLDVYDGLEHTSLNASACSAVITITNCTSIEEWVELHLWLPAFIASCMTSLIGVPSLNFHRMSFHAIRSWLDYAWEAKIIEKFWIQRKFFILFGELFNSLFHCSEAIMLIFFNSFKFDLALFTLYICIWTLLKMLLKSVTHHFLSTLKGTFHHLTRFKMLKSLFIFEAVLWWLINMSLTPIAVIRTFESFL